MYTLYWKTEVGDVVLLLCHIDRALYTQSNALMILSTTH
jgi:hypothetical protein